MSGTVGLQYSEEHAIFRSTARRFFETVCVPYHSQRDTTGDMPRGIWLRAGELGLLGPTVSERDGGSGADARYRIILAEEQARAGVVWPVLDLHNDVTELYVARHATQAQKQRLLPKLLEGRLICTASSSVRGAAVRCRARREGDSFLINGRIFVPRNGYPADIILLAAETGSAERAVSLFVLETGNNEGWMSEKLADVVSYPGTATAGVELKGVRVPAESLLGIRVGDGLAQIADTLSEQRLVTAAAAVSSIERALEITIEYVKGRTAFGRRILDFQNTRFKLVEAKTEATILRVFLDKCVDNFLCGRLNTEAVAMLKWSAADQLNRIVDACVQFHGGYGYILDYPISRMWVASRMARSSGGTSDSMKELIAAGLDRDHGANAA